MSVYLFHSLHSIRPMVIGYQMGAFTFEGRFYPAGSWILCPIRGEQFKAGRRMAVSDAQMRDLITLNGEDAVTPPFDVAVLAADWTGRSRGVLAPRRTRRQAVVAAQFSAAAEAAARHIWRVLCPSDF